MNAHHVTSIKASVWACVHPPPQASDANPCDGRVEESRGGWRTPATALPPLCMRTHGRRAEIQHHHRATKGRMVHLQGIKLINDLRQALLGGKTALLAFVLASKVREIAPLKIRIF